MNRETLITRRRMLGSLAKLLALGAAASTVSACGGTMAGLTLDDLLQKHYLDMDDEELATLVARLEAAILERWGKPVTMATTQAKPGVRMAMTLNLSACIGCGQCAQGCFEENNQTREPAIKWITMLRSHHMKIWNLHDTDTYTLPPTEEDDGNYYLPVACQQCDDPPCVKACPIKATWKESDGITVVDYSWCIGCRYCMAACPYDARRFNFSKPKLTPDQMNPEQGYLSNRVRPRGVVEKCTFCLHRTREGKYPACLEVCPVGARVFGNILDPDSEINYILQNKRVYVLKEDVGTVPRFYYFFD
jgi:Fe-S-cluster-containing dehydrogenase component